jgi:hypothetical protein
MLAHGANPDAMTEEDFELVMVALNDGLIGNKAVVNTLGYLTTAVFNYMRSQNAPGYTLHGILGIMHDYIYKPLSDEEKRQLASQRLLEFMSMKPEANNFLKAKDVT